MDVIVSEQLPIPPSPGEWARRFIRHGMLDAFPWLSLARGPAPDEQTHAIAGTDPASPLGGVLLVSAELHEQLRARAVVDDLAHPDRTTRQAAEAVWLRQARAHQAERAEARRRAADGGAY